MNFSAALIAGGRSQRMGSDKAFLDWHGLPLWRHQWATLQALGGDDGFVCGRPGQGFAGVPVYSDKVEGLGPLGGLVRALEQARHGRVVVLAVDLPAMTSDFLRDRLLASATDEIGAIGRLDGFYEPLAAVYPTVLREMAAAQLASGDRSLQTFCRMAEEAGRLRRVEVTERERPLFRNLNVPADLLR